MARRNVIPFAEAARRLRPPAALHVHIDLDGEPVEHLIVNCIVGDPGRVWFSDTDAREGRVTMENLAGDPEACDRCRARWKPERIGG